MSVYTAVRGQSLQDICLITYGSLDFIVKLANDNSINDLCATSLSGIAFTYDNTLVVSQILQQQLGNRYGTAIDILEYYAPEDGGGYYADEDGNIYIPE